ncbi:MAG: DUF4831 family protein [Bacteroidales bacterium]
MKKLFISIGLVALFLLYAIDVFSQYKVYPIQAEKSKKTTGLVYSLPQTVFQIDVVVLKRKHLRGPFADFAEELLGLKDVVSYDYENYQIADISVTEDVEPDPEASYIIALDQKQSKENQVEFVFNNNGTFQGIESLSDLKKNKSKVLPQRINRTDLRASGFRSLKPSTDSVIRKICVGNKEKTLVSHFKSFAKISDKDLAQKIVEKIERLRMSQLDLISGDLDVAYSKEALAYMDKRLDRAISEYLDLFRGAIIESQEVHHIYFVPKKEKKFEVCRFSNKFGIVEHGSSKGEPLLMHIDLSGMDNLHKLLGNTSAKENDGIFYRVPLNSNVKIVYKDKLLWNSRCLLPQYGPVFQGGIGVSGVEYSENGHVKRLK